MVLLVTNCIVSNALGRIWKEADVLAWHEKSLGTVILLAEIQTKNLPYTSQKHYCLNQLAQSVFKEI
jgi:hypothetical protein